MQDSSCFDWELTTAQKSGLTLDASIAVINLREELGSTGRLKVLAKSVELGFAKRALPVKFHWRATIPQSSFRLHHYIIYEFRVEECHIKYQETYA